MPTEPTPTGRLQWGKARCLICGYATTAEPNKPVLCGLQGCHDEYQRRQAQHEQKELKL